ncbi:MAG: SDR family oxidoreductase [Methylotenera sp.]|nr:SDR family oxidoreductase [Oligoflexia bacterium]
MQKSSHSAGRLHYAITGASRGIGLELAHQALEAGNEVSVVVRNPEKSEGLQALHSKFPETLRIFTGDILSDESIKSFSKALPAGKPVDVLINNAGAYLDGDDEFVSLDLTKVMDSFAMNSVGAMRVTQSLLPKLQKSSHPKLVNITSLMGSIDDNSGGGSYGYRMSKAALNMFNRSFSVDFPKITSVVVHPGWVKTEMGGAGAPTETAESAAGILKLISGLKSSDTGKFFDYEGDSLSW